MWIIFLILITLHGDILTTFQVKKAISDHIEGIVAHPLLGVAADQAIGSPTLVPVDWYIFENQYVDIFET